MQWGLYGRGSQLFTTSNNEKEKKKKMAASHGVGVSVFVLEGVFSSLHRLGFPLPALATMQEAGAHLKDASWNVRKSSTGLPVSFSPSTTGSTSKTDVIVSKSKKRRLRRKRNNKAKPLSSKLPCPCSVEVHSMVSDSMSVISTESQYSIAEEDPDLTLCPQSPDLIIQESELSPSDVAPPVFYHEWNNNGVPGFEVETPKDCFWSPISHRTRARNKSDGNKT